MSEKDINIEYICNKTLLDKDDELVPIILEMIQESYRAGLSQSEIDNTFGLIEHNQMLKDQIRKQQEVIDKAIEYINENKDKYYQDWGQDDCSVDIYLNEYEIKKLSDILKRGRNKDE